MVGEIVEVKRDLTQPEIPSQGLSQDKKAPIVIFLDLKILNNLCTQDKNLQQRTRQEKEAVHQNFPVLLILLACISFCLNYTWNQTNNNYGFDYKSIGSQSFKEKSSIFKLSESCYLQKIPHRKQRQELNPLVDSICLALSLTLQSCTSCKKSSSS